MSAVDLCPRIEPELSIVSLRRDLDLSLCFQDAIFRPALTLLLATILVGRGWWLRSRPDYDRPDANLRTLKAALAFKSLFAVAGIALSFGLVLLGLQTDGATVLAAGARAAFFTVAGAVHWLEFRKDPLPSTPLVVAYATLLATDAVCVRSLLLENDTGSPTAILYLAAVTVTVLLAVLELAFIRRNADLRAAGYSGQFYTRLPTRAVFGWVSPLLREGQRKFLDLADVWQLHPQDHVTPLYARFEAIQRRSPANASLGTHLWRMFGASWMGTAALYFVGVLSTAALPWLIQELLGVVSAQGDPDLPPQDAARTRTAGILLAVAYLVVFCVSELANEHGNAFSHFSTVRLREVLTAVLYRKQLRVPMHVAQGGCVLNHMQVDVEALASAVYYVLWTACSVADFAVGLAWLWLAMGPASVVGMAVLVAFLPINAVLGKFLLRSMDAKLTHMDARVGTTQTLLAGIRTVKLFGWTRFFRDKVQAYRRREMRAQRRIFSLEAVQYSTLFLMPNLACLAMFALFPVFNGGAALSLERVFVTLSTVNLIKGPLYHLTESVRPMVHGLAAYRRIARFLAEPDHTSYVEPIIEDEAEVNDVEVVDASFAWATDPHTGDDSSDDDNDEVPPAPTTNSGKPTLTSISLTIPRGSLTMIVGSVGSGKSSLLSALLGEIPLLSGRVRVRGPVAVTPQQSVLMNATIRDNITFGLPYTAKTFAAVVAACALDADLARFPLGDQTRLGERGTSVSGGQAARIACARALYADAPCSLFDDVLARVDKVVDRHMFEGIFHRDSGYLAGRTRVLVTHAVHHLADADHIVVMEAGEVAEQGTYAELVAREGGRLRAMVDEHRAKMADPAAVAGDATLVRRPSVETDHGEPKGRSRAGSAASTSSTLARRHPHHQQQHAPHQRESERVNDPADEDDDDVEQMQRGQVSADVYLQYLRFVSHGGAALLVLFCTLMTANETVAIYWSGEWGASAGAGAGGDNGYFLAVLAGINGMVAVMALLSTLTFGALAVRAATNASDGLLHTVLRVPLSFFDVTNSGRLLNKFARDMTVIDEDLPNYAYQTLQTTIMALVMLCTVSLATPWFLAILGPLVILFWLVQRRYLATSRELQRLNAVSKSPLFQLFSETAADLASVRAFGQAARFTHTCHNLVATSARTHYAMIAAQHWLGLHLKMIAALIVFSASLLAVLTPGRSAVLIGLSLTQAQDAAWLLDELVHLVCRLEIAAVSVERVKEHDAVPLEASETTPAEVGLPAAWPEHGAVEFSGYAARYRPGLDLALRDVSFKVLPGEKVGIVGRTGSGKSTLTMALFRAIEAAAGSITIDGVRLSRVGLDDVRSRLTLLPQDAFVFQEATVRQNVDPLEMASDAAVWSALDAAHLGDVVRGFDGMLDRRVGDALSAGQAQLLCLARAVLRKSRILILDESTSNTDQTTDALVQATIRTEFAACTVLTIAHRIQTVMDYDKILVLDRGQVAEFGTPAELLARPSSQFYVLAKESGLVR
ncbi:hypothetical protein H9P43_008161 [Blastocladiella emersonii ATCC 22665]|nr:hypothetical protein H9P43_008161 [Blastocladiella emersonii ATCC 22665]